ncbi:sensor histidine kinase [Paenibacillus sp. MBLB4367]|uniref:cache domain-containing sensor histidine kinase n=1 Tax=Paenibacillus sp. MBLB4367 TaxID=3384767 RepID=UPI0039081A35
MLSLLLVLSVLYYKRTTDDFHDKIGQIAQKNVYQTVELFDLLLKGYDSLTKSITGNFDLKRLLAEPLPKDSAVQVINERTITNLLGSVFLSREDLIDIHVFSNTGKIYSYENAMSTIDPEYASRDWFRQIKQSSGEMVWLGVRGSSLIDPVGKRPVFAFGRQLYDLYEHKPIGIVLIETEPSPILTALANLRLSPHSEVYVVSSEDRIMASTVQQADTVPSLREPPRPAGEGDAVVDESSDRFVVSAKPTMADWTIVSMTPDKDLNVELNRTKRFLVMVVSVLVVVSAVLATVVSRSISKPLKRLIQEMRQVERGNFRGMVNVKSYQEINILVASFNQMVNRMDDLIERIKLSSISEKNAQLQALQTQVNPHFLYNTLDMIYWMLDERENDRLGKVVLSLSQMFRYSSHWDESTAVTLREELLQITHYLTIIGIRLEGRLTTEIQVDERWLDARIPKMTLQPIIENAVKHGLEPLERHGILRVYTTASERALHMVIEDNGTGMDAETIRVWEKSLAGTRMTANGNGDSDPITSMRTKRGIGLINLHRRIQLMFGDAYGVSVASKANEGTTVTVSIPIP